MNQRKGRIYESQHIACGIICEIQAYQYPSIYSIHNQSARNNDRFSLKNKSTNKTAIITFMKSEIPKKFDSTKCITLRPENIFAKICCFIDDSLQTLNNDGIKIMTNVIIETQGPG